MRTSPSCGFLFEHAAHASDPILRPPCAENAVFNATSSSKAPKPPLPANPQSSRNLIHHPFADHVGQLDHAGDDDLVIVLQKVLRLPSFQTLRVDGGGLSEIGNLRGSGGSVLNLKIPKTNPKLFCSVRSDLHLPAFQPDTAKKRTLLMFKTPNDPPGTPAAAGFNFEQ